METPHYETAQTINFRLYTIFGFWRKSGGNQFSRHLYNVYSAIIIFSTTMYAILQIADLKDSWADTEELSINLSATTTSLFCLSKVYSLRLNYDRVERLRRKIREFLNVPGIGVVDEDLEIFERNAIHYMKTCKTLYSIVWPTVFTWWVVSALNETLPVRQWIPFEYEKFGLLYYGVFMYQCILLGFFGAIVAFMDLIFSGFIFLICAHFDVLEKNVRKLGIPTEGAWTRSKDFQRKIGLLVRHHREILKTTEEVEDLFRATNLIHFLGMAVLISVTEYDLIHKTASLSVQFFRQVGNLLSASADTFIYCYYGNLLQEKSGRISFAAYDINWIDLTPPQRKMLMMIMARSNKLVRVTAGKMFALNFETYLSVMRISYNLLALLRQTKK